MGLRCSLLGHVFGESTTEHEREEQGGEVVVVERELQLCSRCGAEKVLSENTEVRTLEADRTRQERDEQAAEAEAVAEDAAGAGSTTEDAAGAGSTTEDAAGAGTATEDAAVEDASPEGDGEFQDAEAYIAEATQSSPEPDAAGKPGVNDQPESGESTAEDAPAAPDDDAVILDDDPAQERDRDQWPDEARQETLPEAGEDDSDPSPWPEHEGEDEGFDAEPGRDAADGSVEFGGGLTPEVEPGEADDEGFVEAPTDQPTDESSSSADSFKTAGNPPPSRQGGGQQTPEVGDHGFTSAGPVSPPTGSTDGPDTVLVCPECGFERPAARASLRAGDICPECRRGYLAERH